MAPSNQPSHESCFSCSKKEISCANDDKREPDTKQPNFKRKPDTIQNDNKSESCSCEDCTEPKTCLYYDNRKNEEPANLHLKDTLSPQKSAVKEQKNANLTSSKDSYYTTGSKTRGSDKISKPSDVYGLMVETLSQQESAVEEQKNAYFNQSKGSNCSCTACSKTLKSPTKRTGSQPSDVYELMVAKMSQQESEVDELKNAYLPQSKGSKGSCCIAGSKTKGSDKQSKSPANRTGSLPSGVYGVMRNILSQQESAVEGQKNVYLIQNNGSKGSCTACSKTRGSDKKSKPPAKCQGPKSSGVYGVMIDILSQQELAVEGQKNAHLPQSKDCKNCKQTAVKDKKSAHPPPDICPGIVVTKLASKLAGSDKLNATPSSSGVCTTELLKFVTEYKSTYSIQSKCSNCKSNNISLDRRTTTSSGSCKGMTRSNGSPCNCPSRSNSELNNKQVYNVNKIKTETNPMSYKNCSECSQLAQKKYDSPKYSAEVKLYESTNNVQELFRNILQTQAYKHQNERDECDTYTKNKVSESPGYVFELPKYTYNLTLQNDRHSNKSTTNDSKLSENLPELLEYLTKPKTRESAMNTEVNINRCQVKWNTTDPKRLVLKASCHDDDLATKNKFESCGYVVEVPKVQEKKKCVCDGKLHESTGYVVDLPKVKGKKKCKCSGSAKLVSDKPDCCFKKEKQTASENCSQCSQLAGEVNINRSQVKWIISDASSLVLKAQKDNLAKKKKCESCGNVVELPQVEKKRNCECDDKLFESSGYVVELPKIKEKKKCNCNDSAKFGSDKPECHATETPTEKRTEYNKCTKCISIEFVARPLPKSENPPSQKKCCMLCKSDKNSLASPAQEPPCGCGAQQKGREASPAQEPHCGCGAQQKSSKASPAQEPPCGCGAQQKSCEYPDSESEHYACKMKSMEVPGYVFEIPKKLNSCNCNNLSKNSIQSDIQNICKNMVGTTTETGKASKSLKSPHAPNIYSMLCNNILKKQSETIQMLKKTYLPEKSDVQTDTCACNPPDERIEKRSAKEFSSSIESDSSYTISKCDLLKRIKDIYKACSCKICECKPIKNDAHECQKLCECDECLSPILSYEINQWQICGGKPRDCVQCFKTMNINHCQTLMVAPVGREENVSRLECTPCFEGGTVYPLDSHVVNDMSTSMNRHALCRCEVCLNENCDRNGVDACTCHKHNKIMSKPVGPDTYDFDIRTTKVVYDKPMFRQVGRNYTTAMCLVVPNRYPSFDDRLKNTQTCRCKECECIYCGAQKNN